MKILYLVLSIFSLSVSASPFPQLIKSGEGEMDYLFWTIYRAELYVESLPYQEESFPKALKIEYYRDIDSDDLIDATKDQWLHLGINQALINQWTAELPTIWPDISKGDELIIYVSKDGESTFYSGQEGQTVKRLGQVDDNQFGRAFLDIWLSEKTTKPKLRAKLMGNVE
ncbi:conserved hypothetical protein [Shewanella woodyi ATCC 51908]|uniref:Chalcone isomerase domain-containing protein n=2 Tax=Shewanella woodyi TaxID=60961 RepID=B1KJ26_SHEWM|nr:conserved hypothetical protein [Shewanella woodyi ATCC 51908]